MTTETTELTIGQRLAGVHFNPTADTTIQELKQSFADTLDKVIATATGADALQTKMYDKVIDDLMTAQMWAVKAFTWKL